MSGLTVGPGRYPADMSRAGLGTPPPATPAPPVGGAGGRALDGPRPRPDPAAARAHRHADDGHRRARRGALPVPNPLFGLRVISLPARNATAAIAITYAGMGMLVLAWLWIGRMLRARGAVAPAPDRTQLARTGLLWALPLALAPADVLQGRLQLPRAERDHRTRARPVLARAGRGAGRRRPAHPHDPDDLARHPGPVRPAVPHARPRHHRADRLGRDPGRVRPPRPRPRAAWR